MLTDIVLTLSLNPSMTCENAWPTSRLTPARMRMSVIETTAARLTARFRFRLAPGAIERELEVSKHLRDTCLICHLERLPGLYSNHAAAKKVGDLAVVRGHHDGRSTRVDAQEQLHDLPAVAGSRLPVGSSAMIIRGACTSARDGTRCCSPPERFAG
jgi:hypothetical protein